MATENQFLLSDSFLNLGMQAALGRAKLAFEKKEVPIGAALLDTISQRIIASAHNQTEILHDPSAHAEMIAIRAAAEQKKNWRLSDLILFVTAEPCTMCAGCILQARIQTVVFGCKEPNTGAAGSLYDLLSSSGVRVISGVLGVECQTMMSDFFLKRRSS